MSESWSGEEGVGFDALPAGYRYSSGNGYNYVHSRGYFWTSTEEDGQTGPDFVEFKHADGVNTADIVKSGDKGIAFSVRCMKDAE